MSRQQRQKIDAMLRQPRPEGPPPSVEELRAGFAALMSTMIVPPGFRTSTTTVGGRPALFIEPEQGARLGGTILYFHGGGNVYGSPEAVLSLTAQLVVETGFRAFSPDYRLAPSTRSRPGSRTPSARTARCWTTAQTRRRSRSPATPPAAA